MGVAAIVCILMQKGTNDNIGSLGGSERETDTYAGKEQGGRNRDSILKKLTIVFLVLLMVISIVYFIVLQ